MPMASTTHMPASEGVISNDTMPPVHMQNGGAHPARAPVSTMFSSCIENRPLMNSVMAVSDHIRHTCTASNLVPSRSSLQSVATTVDVIVPNTCDRHCCVDENVRMQSLHTYKVGVHAVHTYSIGTAT
jgi:hypothetical protein